MYITTNGQILQAVRLFMISVLEHIKMKMKQVVMTVGSFQIKVSFLFQIGPKVYLIIIMVMKNFAHNG